MVLALASGLLLWFPAGSAAHGGFLTQPAGRALWGLGLLALTSPFDLVVWSGWYVIHRGPAGIRLVGDGIVMEDRACFRRPVQLPRSHIAGIGLPPLTRFLSSKREEATIGPLNARPNVYVELRSPTAFPEARGLWPTMRTYNSPPPRPRRAIRRIYFRLADPGDVDRLMEWTSAGSTQV
jgi:hypothetical protein